jgi:hypothetical protein
VREIGRPDHASTEQLSALLDDRAEPEDKEFLAGHVGDCPVCANELADLRSVRGLLRALPVYLPPRSFTIPVEPARPAPRLRRLIPLTRVLSAVAAVLCIVLFAADAMHLGDQAAPVPDGGAAFQITTGARATAPAALAKPALSAAEAAKPAEAARPAAPAAAARPAEAPKPADAAAPAVAAQPAEAAKSAFAPAATQVPSTAQPAQGRSAAAPPAPAQNAAPAAQAPAPQAAGAAAQAPTTAQAPVRTALASPGAQSAAQAEPLPPATATVPPVISGEPGQAIQRPGPATTLSSPWLSPVRLWALALAVVSVALLIGSFVLSRRARSSARAGGTHAPR